MRDSSAHLHWPARQRITSARALRSWSRERRSGKDWIASYFGFKLLIGAKLIHLRLFSARLHKKTQGYGLRPDKRCVGIFSKAPATGFEAPGRERRRYPRFETSEATEVFLADGGEPSSPGLIRDISSGGACVMVEREFGVGRQVRFRCSAGAVTAVIRHCSAAPQGYLIGVEFPFPLRLGPDLDRTFPATW